jgi:pyridinium-3,5-bisthiocarboxylic acid mononucleotide nickel chelatase
MRLGYFDCSGGISGMASLAALLDAGADIGSISKEIGSFVDDAPILHAEDVMVGEFRVRHVSVEGGERSIGKRREDLETLLSAGGMPDAARDLALRIYGRLADAEARVHGSSPDRVRFHELGSLRSVVGVVGTALALEQLGIDEVAASAVPFGSGTVETEHGRLAIPTPATLELLRGMPIVPQEGLGELVTPTGAAILAVAAVSFGGIPAMTLESMGYGTGDPRGTRIKLRVVIGTR